MITKQDVEHTKFNLPHLGVLRDVRVGDAYIVLDESRNLSYGQVENFRLEQGKQPDLYAYLITLRSGMLIKLQQISGKPNSWNIHGTGEYPNWIIRVVSSLFEPKVSKRVFPVDEETLETIGKDHQEWGGPSLMTLVKRELNREDRHTNQDDVFAAISYIVGDMPEDSDSKLLNIRTIVNASTVVQEDGSMDFSKSSCERGLTVSLARMDGVMNKELPKPPPRGFETIDGDDINDTELREMIKHFSELSRKVQLSAKRDGRSQKVADLFKNLEEELAYSGYMLS